MDTTSVLYAPQPAAPNSLYIVCPKTAESGWNGFGYTESPDTARKIADAMTVIGEQARAMKVPGVPTAVAYSMSDDNLASAINLRQDTQSVAIGPTGKAEAIATT